MVSVCWFSISDRFHPTHLYHPGASSDRKFGSFMEALYVTSELTKSKKNESFFKNDNGWWKLSQVWYSLLASLILVVGILYCFCRFALNKIFQESSSNRSKYDLLCNLWDYCLQTLISPGKFFKCQFSISVKLLKLKNICIGSQFKNKLSAVRILACFWGLGGLVLATAYLTVLISFVTMPIYQPIIKSVYELPKRPEIRLTVRPTWNPENVFIVYFTI